MDQVITSLSFYAPELIGIVLPPIIEILNKDIPKEKTGERFLASMAICLVVAVLVKWNQLTAGSIDQVIASFGIIFTESQAVYRLYFRNSFIKEKINERFAPTPPDEPLG